MCDSIRSLRALGSVALSLLAPWMGIGCAQPPASNPAAGSTATTENKTPKRSAPERAEACRSSHFGPENWIGRDQDGESALVHLGDADGDGVDDRLSAAQSGGGGYAETVVVLELSESRSTVRVTAGVMFDAMLAFHRVPDSLVRPKLSAARALVEEVLFPRVCSDPDPSLSFLLRGFPQWQSGVPAIPETYAIYSAEPALLAAAAQQGFAGEESFDATKAGGVWVEYLSQNHRRDQDLGLSRDFQEVDSRGSSKLWTTAHGVVVVEPPAGRYAWIYVHPGGRKLRFPSVRDAEFVAEGVRVELEARHGDELGRQIQVALPEE